MAMKRLISCAVIGLACAIQGASGTCASGLTLCPPDNPGPRPPGANVSRAMLARLTTDVQRQVLEGLGHRGPGDDALLPDEFQTPSVVVTPAASIGSGSRSTEPLPERLTSLPSGTALPDTGGWSSRAAVLREGLGMPAARDELARLPDFSAMEKITRDTPAPITPAAVPLPPALGVGLITFGLSVYLCRKHFH